jgi:hypothetical protein
LLADSHWERGRLARLVYFVPLVPLFSPVRKISSSNVRFDICL